jgi:hypothetical protein
MGRMLRKATLTVRHNRGVSLEVLSKPPTLNYPSDQDLKIELPDSNHLRW